MTAWGATGKIHTVENIKLTTQFLAQINCKEKIKRWINSDITLRSIFRQYFYYLCSRDVSHQFTDKELRYRYNLPF